MLLWFGIVLSGFIASLIVATLMLRKRLTLRYKIVALGLFIGLGAIYEQAVVKFGGKDLGFVQPSIGHHPSLACHVSYCGADAIHTSEVRCRPHGTQRRSAW